MVDRDHRFEHQLLVVRKVRVGRFIIAAGLAALFVSAAHAFVGVGASITKMPVNAASGGGGGSVNALLLSTGGSNYLLLSDGVSKLCLSSGC